MYYLVLLTTFLFSCLDYDKQLTPSSEANIVEKNTINKIVIKGCQGKSSDEFNNLKINGHSLLGFNLETFLKQFPNYDSIKEGYYYYGKSNFLFDAGDMVAVEILDHNLYFDGFVSIKMSFEDLKVKFPCSFKNRSKSEYYSKECEVLSLYDKQYNILRIYVSKDKVLGITYSINESDFDEMNK